MGEPLDKVTMTSLVTTMIEYYRIYAKCCHRNVMGSLYIVQCKRDKINRVLSCLLTAALGNTKITQKHTPSIRLTICIKPHVTRMLSVPTMWRLNAMTVGIVEIMTSPHPIPVYCLPLYTCFFVY